ncbi:hypothetical protein F2Q68_00041198 [Brassica cretica]|uniref:Uncharacterized protein n=1 Tax=Brassica cretica TaxID=69181 RepID=A0A8S9MG61_BRACR|nr:hypothetical protein F2Q68_00041198 [Brassica cretica]
MQLRRWNSFYQNLRKSKNATLWMLLHGCNPVDATLWMLLNGCNPVDVGVENGCNEVNVQIPAKYKYVFSQQIMLGQENVTTPVTDRSEYDDRNTDKLSSVITLVPHMHAVRSLRSNRAFVPLGRYVATELFRNIDMTISPCILVYPPMLSPEDRSEPISCFPPF